MTFSLIYPLLIFLFFESAIMVKKGANFQINSFYKSVLQQFEVEWLKIRAPIKNT